MAFVNSQQSRVAVGLLNASGYAKGYQVGGKTPALDTTSLADASYQSIPGKPDATWSIDMMLDSSTASNGQFDVLTDWVQALPYPITFGPAGFSAGSFVALLNGLEGNLELMTSTTDVAMVNSSGEATGGVDWGAIVDDFTAITADTSGTARNNGAATGNGGVAHLHVSAFSGFTSDAITIEHSVNGSTSWATLVTFATATGVTSERVEVAAGTTVRQYLRVVDDVTGTGSITRLVAFSRR